jgi:hypothetical protein
MLETDLERTGRVAPQDVGKQLDRLEERADRLRVPLGYAQRVFILKDHIARVRQQVREPGPLRSH